MTSPPPRQRSVLITGCSTGFGLQAAVSLARAGWRVHATMRNLAGRGALDAAIAAAGGASPPTTVDVTVGQLDVCDTDSIARAVADLLARDGRIDAVVHNAGIARAGFFEDIPDAATREVMETNFFGVLALTRAVLPTMRAQRRGRILVVSSTSALLAEPCLSPYVASKFAIEGWAESVAVELRPFGIDVVLIEPAAYRTEIWNSTTVARPPGSAYLRLVDAIEPKVRERAERHGRDPIEVADRIVALLNAKHPPFRSPIGTGARASWLMRHLLPFAARRRLLTRATGLDRVDPSS